MGICENDIFSHFIMKMCKEEAQEAIPFEVKRMIHNDETKEAFAEYEEMKNNPEKYKRYSTFDKLLNEIDINIKKTLE